MRIIEFETCLGADSKLLLKLVDTCCHVEATLAAFHCAWFHSAAASRAARVSRWRWQCPCHFLHLPILNLPSLNYPSCLHCQRLRCTGLHRGLECADGSWYRRDVELHKTENEIIKIVKLINKFIKTQPEPNGIQLVRFAYCTVIRVGMRERALNWPLTWSSKKRELDDILAAKELLCQRRTTRSFARSSRVNKALAARLNA